MVVEEVSLVDRAANKHRFLIVKRDDAMDDDNTTDTTTTDPSPSAAPTAKLDDGTALGAALTALESLTGLVELLGSLGADQADARLAELAEELRSVAEQLLARSAGDDEDVEARAKGDAATKSTEPSTFAGNVTAAKQALARLAELAAKVPAAETETPAQPEPAVAAKDSSATATPSVTDSLAKLADSFRALSETVKEQQQRLGRVEKQFGLPNSAAPAERMSKATVEDVGWPLDLNKPKDRESVDKAISFHDL
ncbi:MAG: hypothetical protein BWY94_02144 [Actinobacteria bacterium ADurb.BinA094]|nr:MAG: hypothetical protein BWY94_02144 [Actinobacteria bacterium ADurb.BinA094]